MHQPVSAANGSQARRASQGRAMPVSAGRRRPLELLHVAHLRRPTTVPVITTREHGHQSPVQSVVVVVDVEAKKLYEMQCSTAQHSAARRAGKHGIEWTATTLQCMYGGFAQARRRMGKSAMHACNASIKTTGVQQLRHRGRHGPKMWESPTDAAHGIGQNIVRAVLKFYGRAGGERFPCCCVCVEARMRCAPACLPVTQSITRALCLCLCQSANLPLLSARLPVCPSAPVCARRPAHQHQARHTLQLACLAYPQPPVLHSLPRLCFPFFSLALLLTPT